MRADRLLTIILLLQTRGKTTTKALSEELGVSQRTILRDVEALSIAGVPLYTEGGHGGGVALDEQYRTTLTGLNTTEIQTLFIANNNIALREIGLGDASEGLLLKLLAALPSAQRPTVDHIRQRLLVDPAWWWRDMDVPDFWGDLQEAVYEDRLIEVTYEHYDGAVVERVLEPYSLVNKSSLWYVVAQRDNELRTYRVARFHKLRLLPEHFTRRPDFDLTAYWHNHLQEFIETFSEYYCIVRVHPERVVFVKQLMPGRWQVIEDADTDGWLTFQLMLDSPIMAKMLIFGLGIYGEVVEPPELAAEILRDAQIFTQHAAGWISQKSDQMSG